jgi:hypothetical protein
MPMDAVRTRRTAHARKAHPVRHVVLTIILIVGPLTPLIYQVTDKPLYDSERVSRLATCQRLLSSTFRTRDP